MRPYGLPRPARYVVVTDYSSPEEEAQLALFIRELQAAYVRNGLGQLRPASSEWFVVNVNASGQATSRGRSSSAALVHRSESPPALADTGASAATFSSRHAPHAHHTHRAPDAAGRRSPARPSPMVALIGSKAPSAVLASSLSPYTRPTATRSSETRDTLATPTEGLRGDDEGNGPRTGTSGSGNTGVGADAGSSSPPEEEARILSFATVDGACGAAANCLRALAPDCAAVGPLSAMAPLAAHAASATDDNHAAKSAGGQQQRAATSRGPLPATTTATAGQTAAPLTAHASSRAAVSAVGTPGTAVKLSNASAIANASASAATLGGGGRAEDVPGLLLITALRGVRLSAEASAVSAALRSLNPTARSLAGVLSVDEQAIALMTPAVVRRAALAVYRRVGAQPPQVSSTSASAISMAAGTHTSTHSSTSTYSTQTHAHTQAHAHMQVPTAIHQPLAVLAPTGYDVERLEADETLLRFKPTLHILHCAFALPRAGEAGVAHATFTDSHGELWEELRLPSRKSGAAPSPLGVARALWHCCQHIIRKAGLHWHLVLTSARDLTETEVEAFQETIVLERQGGRVSASWAGLPLSVTLVAAYNAPDGLVLGSRAPVDDAMDTDHDMASDAGAVGGAGMGHSGDATTAAAAAGGGPIPIDPALLGSGSGSGSGRGGSSGAGEASMGQGVAAAVTYPLCAVVTLPQPDRSAMQLGRQEEPAEERAVAYLSTWLTDDGGREPRDTPRDASAALNATLAGGASPSTSTGTANTVSGSAGAGGGKRGAGSDTASRSKTGAQGAAETDAGSPASGVARQGLGGGRHLALRVAVLWRCSAPTDILPKEVPRDYPLDHTSTDKVVVRFLAGHFYALSFLNNVAPPLSGASAATSADRTWLRLPRISLLPCHVAGLVRAAVGSDAVDLL